jgi:HisJ family histidinol phosphate phosphatase
MLFLWFYHACRRGSPRFLMVADHVNYLTFEDPGAVNTVRRALKLAHAGDLYGAAETAGVDVAHASAVSDGLRRGMRFSIGAEVDNDPRARPDAQNIVDAMRPDGIIRAVHFVNIEHPEKGADWAWAFDNDEFAHLHDVVGPDRLWELYTAKLFDDLDKLPAHIAGHFYGPAVFGHWPAAKTLDAYEDRLLEICHRRGLAVEINTRPLYRNPSDDFKKKYLEANARLIRKAKARGVGIAIGSDAHSPKDQGNAFDLVLTLLDDAKVNEIVFPVGGRLARVALRATREHLEAQAKNREGAAPGSSITGFSRAELGLPEVAEKIGRASARASRETGSKKRASDATRATKRPASTAPSPKSSARRTAESASQSSRAKAARTPAKPTPPAKSSPAKAPPVKKAAKPAAPAKAAKAVPAKAAKAVKPLKAAKAQQPAKKAVKAPVKPARAKTRAASAAKTAARKATAKKAPVRKATGVAKKSAAKPAAKKPVKKAAKPAGKGSTAKKKPAKRR